MLKQSFLVVLVLAVLAGVTVVARAGPGTDSVGDLKQMKRSGNASLSIEEATKLCNESFVIKMGL